ncbi:MAG: bifunctional 2-C-methyl-D-erythritol 4-phosphate cytidylyltransferase/2-C-methyl-D-erythritol 2,4-cyclodiphosphate synthase [Rickettsiales bacterium]
MTEQTPIVTLIVAAGTSERMGGGIPKQYQLLAGVSLLRRTIQKILPTHCLIQVVIHPDHVEFYRDACGDLDILPPVTGGVTRQESVYRGLQALQKHNPASVLIHDAARPFISKMLIKRIADALQEYKAVIPALAIKETVKKIEGQLVKETIARESLVAVQTPQGFDFQTILAAHEKVKGSALTDDAAVCEAAGIAVQWIDGEARNIKITTKEDQMMAEEWLKQNMEIRIGQGIDVHRMVTHRGPDRHVLRLGGIDLPSTKCLEGHSDADAVLHAIVDAILGTIGEGDIGVYFPPSEAKWRGVDSAIFLQEAMKKLAQKGGTIVNCDVTILCEIPKIGPHRESMRGRIAEIMNVDASRINIKATTTESLGFLGRKEGLCAQAIVSVKLSA